jgi:hypothetical protein
MCQNFSIYSNNNYVNNNNSNYNNNNNNNNPATPNETSYKIQPRSGSRKTNINVDEGEGSNDCVILLQLTRLKVVTIVLLYYNVDEVESSNYWKRTALGYCTTVEVA